MHITVVGAGVIGLTTALTLQEYGHDVRVIARATGPATTSSIAGAVWFPYRVGPPDKVAVWAARTRTWLTTLARSAPHSGVDLLVGYEIDGGDGSRRPWWAAVPTMEGDHLAEAIHVEFVPAPVAGALGGWRFEAPRAQPSLFLPYLEAQLHRPIEHREVRQLAAEPGDAVINCTGLAARELAGDDLVFPLLGQIVIVEHANVDRHITVTDDRDPEAIFYAIPRRDELVLGGCSLPHPPGAEPEIDTAITARILAQARALGLSPGAVRTELVGLRPYRKEVRLERDPDHVRVIHNYGHGGAGFTLCRGCAESVAALIG